MKEQRSKDMRKGKTIAFSDRFGGKNRYEEVNELTHFTCRMKKLQPIESGKQAAPEEYDQH